METVTRSCDCSKFIPCEAEDICDDFKTIPLLSLQYLPGGFLQERWDLDGKDHWSAARIYLSVEVGAAAAGGESASG
jgi:hypothetical protein